MVEVLSEPTSVPATAGDWEVDPEGAIFPRAELTVVMVHGIHALRLGVADPAGRDGWAAGMFTAVGVRHLLTALEAKLALMECTRLGVAA